MNFERALVNQMKQKEQGNETTPAIDLNAAKSLAAPAPAGKGKDKKEGKDAPKMSLMPVETAVELAARKAENPIALVLDMEWSFD